MAKQLTSSIDIDAPPDQVWAELVDLSAYTDWNPFIVRAEGPVEEGARLTLRMQPSGGRAMTLRPRLVEVSPGRELRWLGRFGLPGLMDAEHTFELQARGTTTRLVQRETFRGALVPLVARSLVRGTLPAFVAMNEALKRRAEQRGTPTSG